jgi:hypothetical protein
MHIHICMYVRTYAFMCTYNIRKRMYTCTYMHPHYPYTLARARTHTRTSYRMGRAWCLEFGFSRRPNKSENLRITAVIRISAPPFAPIFTCIKPHTHTHTHTELSMCLYSMYAQECRVCVCASAPAYMYIGIMYDAKSDLAIIAFYRAYDVVITVLSTYSRTNTLNSLLFSRQWLLNDASSFTYTHTHTQRERERERGARAHTTQHNTTQHTRIKTRDTRTKSYLSVFSCIGTDPH